MADFRALVDVKDKPIAYSPAKFAELFNHEQTWAYRLIYAGKVKVITEFGNKMIPASELERILSSARETVASGEGEAEI